MSISKPFAGSYDISKVDFYLGPILVTGFAEGDSPIKIDWKSDVFGDVVGCDGEVVRNLNNDDRATVTIQLMPTSKSIALIEALIATDKATVKAAAPLLINDRNSGTKITGQAWIAKRPARQFGQKVGAVEYQFTVAALITANLPIVATPIG